MKFQKIYKKASYICLALFPFGFIIGGINEIPNRTERAASYFFLLGAVYMQFHCLYSIEKGSINIFGFTHELSKEKEPFLFWPYVGTIMLMTASIAPILLYRVFS